MPKKICFAILNSASAGLRKEHLQKLIDTAEYSRVHEPGVLAYCVCVPRDDDQSTIYMIEMQAPLPYLCRISTDPPSYANQAAFEAHMKSPPVLDMLKWMEGQTSPLFAQPPAIYMLDIFDGDADKAGLVQRAAAAVDAAAADPYLVAAEVAYKTPQLLQQALPYWADVVASTRAHEPGVLVYAVARDPTGAAPDADPTAAAAKTIYTFEAYQSQDYLSSVHVPSAAVQANVAATKDHRDGVKHHLLQRVGGFLSKI